MAYREAAATYRDVIAGDRCKVCGGEPDARCPGCAAGVCRAHAFSPEGACEACATATLTASTRAGLAHLTTGLSVTGGAFLAFLYAMAVNGGTATRSRPAAPVAERIPWVSGWICVGAAVLGLGLVAVGLARRRRARRIARRERTMG